MMDTSVQNHEALSFCERFLNSNSKKYLFGRNIYADKIVESIAIEGFIDDYYKAPTYLNLPVVPLDEVPADALVLVLSGGSPISALQRVRSKNLASLDYFSFLKHTDLALEPIYLLGDFEGSYQTNQAKFERIHNRLSDETSRKSYEKIVNFKRTLNIEHLNGFKNLETQQYFEDFLDLNDDEVFVDVGGFDGYTSKEFARRTSSYEKIYFVEPFAQMMNKAKEDLAELKHIEFLELGASDKKETLRFSEGDSRSRIDEAGEVIINADRLDCVIDGRVSFIKMDIEGAEMSALCGAEELIKAHHPKLAICVYHKPNDFWEIPEKILSIREDYDLYFRHYTESIYESVMFFIPK